MGPEPGGARARGLRADRAVWPLEAVGRRPDGPAPADRYRFVDGRGEIGLISSVTEPFCGTCNRLRLTADGAVRNCLFSDDELSVRDLLRDGGTDAELALAAAAGRLGKAAGSRHQRARVSAAGAFDVDDRGLGMAVLRLFGPAREAAGVARVDVAGGTVGDVLRTAEARYGSAFADLVGISQIWINGEPATPGASVAERDEVAVVPPVSGG